MHYVLSPSKFSGNFMSATPVAAENEVGAIDSWGNLDLARLPTNMRECIPDRFLWAAQKELFEHFRVDDLSLREQIQLREALQLALRLYIANQSVIDRGEVRPSRQINVVREAVLLWLTSNYRPDTYEHPVVDIYLGGQYFGKNMEIWRNFVGDIRAQREQGRRP